MKISATPATNSANKDDIVETITSMDTPRRAGLILFGLVFGVFGIWAAIAPLDGAAIAPGSVTVRSFKKMVQHLEGGIVSDILVRDGDLVQEGQTLLVLDDTQASAELQIVTAQHFALRAREARLIAERDGLDQINFPSILDRNDARVQQEIAAQNEIFEARKTSNEGRIEILQQRIQQLENQVAGMMASKETKDLLAASYSDEMQETQTLLDQGFSELTRLRQAERNFASYTGEAAELTSNIAATEVQIGETRLQVIQLESDFRNDVVSELSDTQTRLQDIEERITALTDVVRRTEITAPETGIVNGMQVHTIGGVIGSGTPIAEIVPESDELIIEASVSPVDIDRVSEGQEARIRFVSFGSRTPTVFGSLLSLSADAITDPNTGATYYLARVDVDPESLEELGDLALLPGMPAEVHINTGSRTFLSYLLKPLSNTVARSFSED